MYVRLVDIIGTRIMKWWWSLLVWFVLNNAAVCWRRGIYLQVSLFTTRGRTQYVIAICTGPLQIIFSKLTASERWHCTTLICSVLYGSAVLVFLWVSPTVAHGPLWPRATIGKGKGKGQYSSSWEPHLRATGRHLPYGITQCYLPPDTSECAPPNPSHAG